MAENLSICDIILGIKEIKIDDLLPEKVYMYFSHTLKGQSYNMPMLKKLLDLNCTMMDYERIIADNGQRLIFFGLQAGQAGIIDTLWAYGKRLAWEDIASPFQNIKQAHQSSTFKRIMRPQGVAIAILNIGVWISQSAKVINNLRIVVGPSGPIPPSAYAGE